MTPTRRRKKSLIAYTGFEWWNVFRHNHPNWAGQVFFGMFMNKKSVLADKKVRITIEEIP